MKIIHINCSDSGSTGKIIDDISSFSKFNNIQHILLTPEIVNKMHRNFQSIKIAYKYERLIYFYYSLLRGYRYGSAFFSTLRIIHQLKNQQPDIVHLHSANCNMVNLYTLFDYLSKKNIPTVVTNHAEFYYTGNCPHTYNCHQWINGCHKCPNKYIQLSSLFFDFSSNAWIKMKDALNQIYHLSMVSVSPWSLDRAMKSGISSKLPHHLIMNGIDTQIFNQQHIKRNYTTRKRVLFVTAHFSEQDFTVKGGGFVKEIASNLKDIADVFIVGNTHDEKDYQNVYFKGTTHNQMELADYYGSSDVTILLSSRETFGMTVVESLCCGTPVVGFKSGGPESIALQEYSSFCDFNDIHTLSLLVREMIELNRDPFEISKKATSLYNKDKMASKYIELYKKLLNNSI